MLWDDRLYTSVQPQIGIELNFWAAANLSENLVWLKYMILNVFQCILYT